jgi:hypothetical protein
MLFVMEIFIVNNLLRTGVLKSFTRVDGIISDWWHLWHGMQKLSQKTDLILHMNGLTDKEATYFQA